MFYVVWLSADCRVLKNRKFIGPLPEQNVRQKPKPFIIEMNRYIQWTLFKSTMPLVKSFTNSTGVRVSLDACI